MVEKTVDPDPDILCMAGADEELDHAGPQPAASASKLQESVVRL